ncbi:hypothetical protein [Pontibacter mangrovi]|uniref:Lipocalin-like domain-containing protein n=1 Tax=Pontibacter mangrovi TaxID=2589816 RepID=A0A501W7K6_9BACT|nr:hypothetical protein [Pontibacter mangrovi]TPE43231.1 hypothetical protein FJM65_14045 [Pontibacter mangrovi]
MLLRNYILYLALLLTAGMLVSCDDDDDEPAEPSKTETLTASPWQGDKVLLNGIDVAAIPGVGDNADVFETLRLTFHEDNTYLAEFQANGQEQTMEGDWSFNADETAINVDMFGEMQLERLTENNLDVSMTLSNQNMILIGQIIGITPQQIEAYTNGDPVETEMRFTR